MCRDRGPHLQLIPSSGTSADFSGARLFISAEDLAKKWFSASLCLSARDVSHAPAVPSLPAHTQQHHQFALTSS